MSKYVPVLLGSPSATTTTNSATATTTPMTSSNQEEMSKDVPVLLGSPSAATECNVFGPASRGQQREGIRCMFSKQKNEAPIK